MYRLPYRLSAQKLSPRMAIYGNRSLWSVAALPAARALDLGIALALVLGLAAPTRAQSSADASPDPPSMLAPALDAPAQPFSYYAQSVDEIGVMDAEAATEITPEGYLRTGFAELMFFTGPGEDRLLLPVQARLRTLESGHLPIDHYQVTRNGIDYRFTVFAATLDGQSGTQAGGPSNHTLVNFIRVRMVNHNPLPTRAVFAVATRYDAEPNTAARLHGEFRFDRPVVGRFPGDYRQLGDTFHPDWVYGFGQSSTGAGRFLRDGKLLYAFPSALGNAPVQRSLTLATRYNYEPDIASRALAIQPTTPVGVARWMPLIPAGADVILDLKMPVVPVSDPDSIAAIEAARFDAAKAQVTTFWQHILAQGMQVTLPEQKAVDTFDMSLIYDLIARDHIGPNYIQTVNKLHYHSFYLRDGADIAHMYDLTGYPAIARQVLDFFALSQKPDGNFLSQSQQYDGWGEALWAYGQHYRLTHDPAFAAWALPQIDRAVDWLVIVRAADPLHLMPASNVLDNEYLPGHLTGYNFLALSGLRVSIQMAGETGHPDLAQKWQAVYDSYRRDFLAVLDKQTAANHQVIPPALDGNMGGQDWGNLLAVVPEPTLDPHDPRVTATLRATQAKYQEGIMTYWNGYFLHHYLTIKNTLTEVARGDQQQATSELYGLLLHTSSTQAGFEFAMRPWGERNFQDNLSPHGWFAAEYRTLLRQMLLREDGNDLHLLSVISPAWIGAGKTIAIAQAPTQFGTVAYTLTQPDAHSAHLRLDTQFQTQPSQIVVHIPWFMRVTSAQADGKSIAVTNGELRLSPNARELRIEWAAIPSAPGAAMSYDHTVQQYKAEYARRYNAWMHGQTTPAAPAIRW